MTDSATHRAMDHVKVHEKAHENAPQGGTVLKDGAVWPEDAIEVARIVDAWGIKGGIKLQPFSSDPQALFCTKKWFIAPALPQTGVRRPTADAPEARRIAVVRFSEARLLEVTSAKEQGDIIVATVDTVTDRNQAESLRGARVFVSRTAFPTPNPDEFYWIDLIGLSVVNREGDKLGEVADLMDTGPHCVLRCVAPPVDLSEDGKDREHLIPFVAAYIDKVSLPERLIVVDWGLDY